MWTEEVPQTAHRSPDTQRSPLRTEVVQSDASAPAHTSHSEPAAHCGATVWSLSRCSGSNAQSVPAVELFVLAGANDD